ncbi:MAG: hypothetical protein NMNS01_24840 [Nitrosomonas sp.]|nr:MAG: hypothetical protein NMNS01_24840 [Nitrosomonas sp.]
MAEVQLSPNTLNAVTVHSFIGSYAGELDITEAVAIIKEKPEKINGGDLSELESTLAAQTVSLNSIFNALANRAAINMGHDLKIFEAYMRLALKAQAQCIRTAEVLSAIKNPPVVFANQTNIAHGHQQVNNGNQSTRAGKANPSNKLLNEDNYATLDTRGKTETGRTDKEMATMEIFDGSKNTRR